MRIKACESIPCSKLKQNGFSRKNEMQHCPGEEGDGAKGFATMYNSTCKVYFDHIVQGYLYDQRLENVDIDFNVPHMPIVGLGQ